MGDTAVATAKFVSLIGDELWGKRMANLRAGLKRSAFEAKVIVDYFWLELVIDDACTQEGREILEKAGAVVDLLAAQSFATTIVQVHDHLTKRGKNALVGRLRAALQSEGGMAPLYIEMEVTRQLWDAGFEVTFTDLEGLANFDLLFRNARADGEVECKAISVDAGRKIHRKHFYRFIDAVSEQIASHIEGGADDIVIVDLDDRLPSEAAKHEELRVAFVEFLAGSRASDRGSFFSLTRETFSKRFSQEQLGSQATFHEGCRKLYGSTCTLAAG